VLAQVETGVVNGEAIEKGWMLWPPIPFSYNTINDIGRAAPSPPDGRHLAGHRRHGAGRAGAGDLRVPAVDPVHADRDVHRLDHRDRGGALQGFFGGWLDLVFQRFIEIWVSTPSLYIIIIMFAILGRSFWLLVFLTALFGWPALVGVVRAEFLRARNFEYVRAARALGVSNGTIMFRHMLPNAMVATLTLLPFIITGTIGTLASARLPGLRPAVLGAVAGRTHASGQAEPAGAVARLHRLHHLRGDAVASRLHLRGHPRRLRSQKDLPVSDPVLKVENLTVSFRQDGAEVRAVRGVSYTVGRGETVALVGESGRASRSRRCPPCRSCPTARPSAGRSATWATRW
jgi:hypothetical protein